jgi:REase_MTES_1575
VAEIVGTIVERLVDRMRNGGDPVCDWSFNSDLIRRRVGVLCDQMSATNEEAFYRFVGRTETPIKGRMESPIERIALAALLVLLPQADIVEAARSLKDRDDWLFAIVPQMRIAPWRIDFGVLNRATSQAFALECDGREFHRQSAVAAIQEIDRTVDLWERGIIVHRVSGAELFRDPLLALEAFVRKVRGYE